MRIAGWKSVQLISALGRDPSEFLDRLRVIAASRLSRFGSKPPAYAVSDWGSVVAHLGDTTGCSVQSAIRDSGLREVEASILERMEQLPSDAPFGTFHNGDLRLGRLCYALVVAMKPKCVVETGVCYGVTSAFILAGLARNRTGMLHSVDLPPLARNGARFVGWAIPNDTLKEHWRLHLGPSAKVLPPLLGQLGRVDIFVHDSLHTYGNMKSEFGLAWPHIRPGGLLLSDDIQGNAAFRELVKREDVRYHAAVRQLEKDSLFGVAIKKP